MRILVADDEVYLAEALKDILKKCNYTVDVSNNGEDALDNALTGIYDVIVLDIMMPKLNGIEVLQELRKNNISTPVMLLTAKTEVSDKVSGLDSGADDYLAKPFNTDEFLARVRALSRRRGDTTILENPSYGDITLDRSSLKIIKNDKEVTLTKKEFDLLEYLINNSKISLSKEKIIEKIWGFESDAEANHVEVYISFLRKKLAFLSSSVVINTVRGVGYMLTAEEK